MTRLHKTLRPRAVTGLIGCVVIGGLVAGCGGSGSSGNNQSTVGSGPESATNGQPSFQNFAAAAGKVTGVGSAGATVNTSNGAKKVAFGTVTTFSMTSTTTRSAVAVGDCVRVTSLSTGAHPTARPTAAPTASPGATFTAPKSVTARTVTITSTTKCPSPTFNRSSNGGAPGGFGGEGGPSTGTAPVPTGSPSPGNFTRNFGRAGGFPGGFATGIGVMGTVKSVSRASFVVTSSFGRTTSTTVATSSSTTYSVTATARRNDVKTGQCLTAIGSTASDGTLDARTVSLSSPVNGSCPNRGAGFTGGFNRPPGGNFSGSTGAGTSAGGSGA